VVIQLDKPQKKFGFVSGPGFEVGAEGYGRQELHFSKTQSRRACPELAERGRLKVVQEGIGAYFQPRLSKLNERRLGSATTLDRPLPFPLSSRASDLPAAS
jgi:hypothetical protein